MNQNWRSPVVENQTVVQAKSDNGDDDDKTLVDEDEECLSMAEHDKLYVSLTSFLNWQDANDSKSMLYQKLSKWF